MSRMNWDIGEILGDALAEMVVGNEDFGWAWRKIESKKYKRAKRWRKFTVLGVECYKRKDIKKAINYFEKAGNYSRAAEICEKIGDYKRAIRDYKRSDKYYDRGTNFEGLGRIAEKAGDFKRAFKYYLIGPPYRALYAANNLLDKIKDSKMKEKMRPKLEKAKRKDEKWCNS